MEECKVKQVIIMRKDLQMRKGKMIAQGAHASVDAFLQLFKNWSDKDGVHYHLNYTKDSFLEKWMDGSFAKICLYVDSEDELVNLYERFCNEKPEIPAALITDAGKTEFHGEETVTCMAAGPYWADEIDEFTRHLSLL